MGGGGSAPAATADQVHGEFFEFGLEAADGRLQVLNLALKNLDRVRPGHGSPQQQGPRGLHLLGDRRTTAAAARVRPCSPYPAAGQSPGQGADLLGRQDALAAQAD